MKYKEIDKLKESGIAVIENEPMNRHTSFKIGGPADRFVVVNTNAELKQVLSAINAESLPMFLLGNGSNLLISDEGIRGVVLKLAGDFEKIELVHGDELVVGSAALLSAVCKFARDNELSGLEFAYGIPGSIGGAAYMNAGAYGGEMIDVVTGTEHISRDGELGVYSQDELDFSYRHSAYSGSKLIITKVKIKLKKGNKDDISAKMDELMQKRLDKQPYNMPSAGSTFKRPEGYFAAALIEECGLKGERLGTAQVSDKHSGFIISTGTEENPAKCADVVELIERVKAEVFTQRKIALECEVMAIGPEIE